MRVRAVGDDLSILVGQQLGCQFFDLFSWDVQGSGNMGFAKTFMREGLDHLDALLAVELGFQTFGRNSIFHSGLVTENVFDAPAKRLAPRKLIFGSVAYGSPAVRGL